MTAAVSSRDAVLISGATGFVGMEVLARYLEQGTRPIICLVRAADDDGARERIAGVLRNLFGRQAERYAPRVEAYAAELVAPALGLTPRRREELAERVSTIVHSAASVSFSLPLAEAREINLTGTSQMLELAALAQQRGGLRHFGHVSTAYVAGTHEGRFTEHDLDVGQGFRNAYEQSKFEAEGMVRGHDGLPWTILRPSIVVGDRRSGWTAAFNVLYWPLRAFSCGLFKTVPATESAPVDVVSVDYVADAIYELLEAPDTIGQTYHLTAGADASTIGEIAAMASGYFKRPLPRVVTPAEFETLSGTLSGAALESSRVYFPYFSIGTVFEDGFTRARLLPAGISASPLREYLERLLDFATLSRWGKRPITRFAALGRPSPLAGPASPA
jgi:thioester reductase-like protein